MAIAVKKNTAFAVKIESVEGEYEAPDSAAAFVQVLADGAEVNGSKELLERNIFTGSIGMTSPRTGQFQVTGSLPVEARASSTVGGAPEFDALIKSALGDKRTISTTTTTKASGNTATVLHIEDADISKFAVGDIVMTKKSGAYHVSPITAKSTGAGTATITLLIPHPDGDHPDSVVIEKATIYTVSDDAHPSLSISKYLEDAILEQATGCRVSSMSLENFATGQIPSLNFGFEGMNFDRSETAIPYTPNYDSQVPPIVLDGRCYMDTAEIDINELSVTLENTIAFKTSINAENGRVAGRATQRKISGSINPFKEDDNIDLFTKFKENTAFKLFAYAKVPSSTAGQFAGVVAIYMPNCVPTELAEADQDGLLQEGISFSADRGTDGDTDEIYIAFI